jgi:hypothetical protein
MTQSPWNFRMLSPTKIILECKLMMGRCVVLGLTQRITLHLLPLRTITTSAIIKSTSNSFESVF